MYRRNLKMEDSKTSSYGTRTKIEPKATKTETKTEPSPPNTKSYWVPDEQGGFMEATLKEDDGKSAKVIVKGFEVRNDFSSSKFSSLSVVKT